MCATNSFDIFCKALKETGLDDKLNDLHTHFTVFAPTEAAFHRVLYDLQYNSIYACPKDTLRELLLLHIRENQVLAKDGLKNRCGQLMEMANNDSTRTVCENNANKIFQKGAGNSGNEIPEVISFNIEACNGILHIVNEVILPRYVLYKRANNRKKETHDIVTACCSIATTLLVVSSNNNWLFYFHQFKVISQDVLLPTSRLIPRPTCRHLNQPAYLYLNLQNNLPACHHRNQPAYLYSNLQNDLPTI